MTNSFHAGGANGHRLSDMREALTQIFDLNISVQLIIGLLHWCELIVGPGMIY